MDDPGKSVVVSARVEHEWHGLALFFGFWIATAWTLSLAFVQHFTPAYILSLARIPTTVPVFSRAWFQVLAPLQYVIAQYALGLTVIAVCAPLLSVLIARVCDRLTPIRFVEDGVHTYDGFGRRVFVRWDAIKQIRNFVLWPGLKWLLLDDGRGFLLLGALPTFAKDKGTFYRDLVASAGEDNLVAQAFKQGGFGAAQ